MSVCGGERCVGSREERKAGGEEKEATRETRERQRNPGDRAGGMKTAQDFFATVNVHAHACSGTNAHRS